MPEAGRRRCGARSGETLVDTGEPKVARGTDKKRRRTTSVRDGASSLPRVWEDPTLRKMVVPVDGEDLEPLASADPDGEGGGARAGEGPEPPAEGSPEAGAGRRANDSFDSMTTAEVENLPTANLEWIGDSQDDDDERRIEPRTPVSGGVLVTINGQDFSAEGVDVSRGGICFQPVPYWVRRGDPVMIEMGEPPTTQKVLGRVAWRRRLDDASGDLMIGVRFSRPLEDEPSVDYFRSG